MDVDISHIFGAIIVGTGATVIVDFWTLFLKRAFAIPSTSYCLVGRWVLHMPEGRFTHRSISAAQQKRFECVAGWIAHYVIGVVFAFVFIVLVSESWLMRPTLVPALVFGAGTVLFPFLLMQPSFGLGFAASKTTKPMRARLKSLMTHSVFGIGLYVSAWGVKYVLPAQP